MTMRHEALLIDSGFFFALFDPRDSHHAVAGTKREWVEICTLIVPWPVLYETVNTRLARRPETISRFESLIRRPDAVLLDDSPYRQDAYEDTLERAKKPNRPKSLVDSILYAIIEDPNVRIDAMLTFNLRDFGGVCQSNRVELL